MSTILIVDDDPAIRKLIHNALANDGYTLLQAPDAAYALELLDQRPVDVVITDYQMPGMDGVQFLDRLRSSAPRSLHPRCIMITAHGTPQVVVGALREQVHDFLVKPFNLEDLRQAVLSALAARPAREIDIDVVSALPEWLEVRVPCDLDAVPKLDKLLGQLREGLSEETGEAISQAFREMLQNAIEHGGEMDPSRYVTVARVRLKRAILYRIKDPGPGFLADQLDHAAISNPPGDLLKHAAVREKKGLRAGGFGLLLTRQVVDELVFNEMRNEVIFVKYLP